MPPKKKTSKKSTSTKSKGSNPWIVHVKETQKKLGITYTEALKKAKLTYKKIS